MTGTSMAAGRDADRPSPVAAWQRYREDELAAAALYRGLA